MAYILRWKHYFNILTVLIGYWKFVMWTPTYEYE